MRGRTGHYRRPVKRLALVMALVAALAVGCGGDDEPGGGDAAEETAPDATLLEGDSVQIKAVDNSWQPEASRIAAGTEVTFVNEGQNDHNLVPEDADAAWAIDSEDFHPDAEVSYTFDEPGTYRFYCSIHGTLTAGMPGVLVVE
jgi:plastocyanin